MKKTYCKPTTEVISIETSKILCGSGDRGIWDYDDAFSQVPKTGIPSLNELA